MKIKHHPDVSTLMSCAAGSQPEAIAAVMAAHISMCPKCAAQLRGMEEIGAALFEGMEPRTVSRAAPLAQARSREAEGEAGDPPLHTHSNCNCEIPAPLQSHIGTSLDTIAWRRLAPGVWHYPLELSNGARGHLTLLKVAPGTAMPEHGHGGTELTLLLRGSYRDQLGEFRRGDVADVDEDVEHQPVADATEGCICLVASDSKAKFKSLVARLVQPLTGM